jgi:hypothetical protein
MAVLGESQLTSIVKYFSERIILEIPSMDEVTANDQALALILSTLPSAIVIITL